MISTNLYLSFTDDPYVQDSQTNGTGRLKTFDSHQASSVARMGEGGYFSNDQPENSGTTTGKKPATFACPECGMTMTGDPLYDTVYLYSQPRNVWDEVTYPLPNSNRCTVEV